jgi:hypothetical protein
MAHSVMEHLPYLLAGPHNPMFLRNNQLTGTFIKERNLKPYDLKVSKALTAQEVGHEPFWWRYGGMLAAHLHFDNQIYILNADEWKAFSKSLIEAFRENLSKASTVSFHDAQALAGNLENVLR